MGGFCGGLWPPPQNPLFHPPLPRAKRWGEKGQRGVRGGQKPLERIRREFCPIVNIRDAREGIASAAIAASQ